jgi:hypothetical protein
VGLRGDGRVLQLNSYENRVFQVFLEDGDVPWWPSSTGPAAGATRRSWKNTLCAGTGGGRGAGGAAPGLAAADAGVRTG